MTLAFDLLMACLLVMVLPTSSLLHPQPGISLRGHSQSHPLCLEVFLDLNCEYSKKSWMTMMDLSVVFGERLEIVIQQFPQPYHTFAFILTQGYFLVHKEAPEAILNYTDLVYDHLASFNNENTFNLTTKEVIEILADLQFEATGINQTTFERKIHEHHVATSKIWQYAADKGVAGTPWYYLNGYDLHMNPKEHLGLEYWKQRLGRLLGDIPAEEDAENTFAGDDLAYKEVPSGGPALTQSPFLFTFTGFFLLGLLI
ncbi:hypothetical protein CAPTEDRAFT_216673 [Capitella teleta]|uniref:Thioredoxin-like fold domain-containing protein n=1 Tax=Capitella teleta TaxID=283909 RepID=R7VLV7_CAPTE|nr:hypothetical protein CAPTEDRAFT_216673 [Capitella teleta]|eukprot:ELU18601.1 hypothetical protein CAPTEDRAFT_216673 [Capitella teleta]